MSNAGLSPIKSWFASHKLLIVPTSFQYPLKGYANNLLPVFNKFGIIFLPKSFFELGSFSSSIKYFSKISALKI